jgi:hypothetical protein
VAVHAGTIYLDLADTAWRVVDVTPTGWRIVTEPPVRFRRPKGMQPLPDPLPGGTVDDLRPFVNVASEDDWRLLVAWLVAALAPTGPYPVLAFSGEQGSAKSTTARVLRALVDPNSTPLRAEPRTGRDLIIGAVNNWLLALDNLSSVPVWLSDSLCRLATGGGFATRELYSNDEETTFDAMRPVLLTGIDELLTRGDLIDRAITLTLPAIPDDRRQPETDFWQAFEAARPTILGALLTVVAGALADRPTTRLERLPRMADFALWATAAERALGWEPGSFLTVYTANRATANALPLEASPLVPFLRDLSADGWQGSARELYTLLTDKADDATKK